MQHKNLLKQLTLALLMTVAVPYAKSQVAHVGDILCTSGVYVSPAEYEASGLEAMAVIFYVDATGQHGWAVDLEDLGSFKICTTGSSANNYSPLTNYNSVYAAIYDLDGMFNTQEMLVYAQGFSNQSFPAYEALDVVNGWYLPAIGQINYLYGNLVEVNAGLVAVGGTAFEMSSSWEYWSSTEGYIAGSYEKQYSLTSTGQINSNGERDHIKRIRAARNF